MKSRQILILSFRDATVHSLQYSMRRMFPDDDVRFVTPMDICDGALENPSLSLLLMPGITGEVNALPGLLGENGLRRIERFMRRGGVVAAFCSSAFTVSAKTLWRPAWASQLTQAALHPLFNGIALGPALAYGRPFDPGNKYSDVRIVPVKYRLRNGPWIQTGVPYANGPMLLPARKEGNVDTLGVLSEIPGQPATIMRKAFGPGSLYLLGVLPDMTYDYVAYLHANGHAEAIQTLYDDFVPYKDTNRAIWADIGDRLEHDMQRGAALRQPNRPRSTPDNRIGMP